MFLILPGPTNTTLPMVSQGVTAQRAMMLLATVVLADLVVVLPVSSLATPFLQATLCRTRRQTCLRMGLGGKNKYPYLHGDADPQP
ncbi:hypothetical protein [Rhizobium sp. F40D2]|uniref:hypothetical protein n=1 Tax=Rhizobium sp. F40D2 TaxID=3453141 RepID=UPI003F253D1A